MLKEEAIKELEELRDEWSRHIYSEGIRKRTSLDMAIEALEKVEEFEKAHIITGGRLNGRTYAYKCGLEDGKCKVLDKLRAEIEEVYNDRPHSYNHSQRTELFCEVMKIIDKYKAESEE